MTYELQPVTPKQNYSPEDKIRITNMVCEEVKKNQYTIGSICKQMGVEYSTFRAWVKKDKDFRALYNDAKYHRKKSQLNQLKVNSDAGILKLAGGYEYEEEMIEGEPLLDDEHRIMRDDDGNIIFKNVKNFQVKKKQVSPNAAINMFIQSNLDNKNFGKYATKTSNPKTKRPIVINMRPAEEAQDATYKEVKPKQIEEK